MKMKKNIRVFLIAIVGIIVLNVLSAYVFFRLDLTSEKRYSISENTKKLLGGLTKDTQVRVYLDGDLNPSFLRLKKASGELLDEFAVYADKDFSYEYIDPSAGTTEEARNKTYMAMERKGMRAFTVAEKDDAGKRVQKVIFPWMEIIYGKDTIRVNMLKQNSRKSGYDNINVSIENLEFEVTDALRIKAKKQIDKIAFIEGHGELPAENVFDASETLSKYFQVDRGIIGNDPNILSPYKAIVIADPKLPFSEQDKFIIDQYIMKGGKVLWLIDGVRMSMDSLATMGMSPAIQLDLNLEDMMFKYGLRIMPVVLQDMQCAQVPMNVARKGEEPKYEPMPWFYTPLLLTYPRHPITKNLVEVRADFASGVEGVNDSKLVSKTPLLATSNATHMEPTPAIIDLNAMYEIDEKTHFNVGYVPVGVLLEGKIQSVFANRMVPEGIVMSGPVIKESKATKMIVVADGDIIKNDIQQGMPLPMGYDRLTRQEYGNRDFILNSVLYMVDEEGWLDLRSREFKLRMLNKSVITDSKKKWQIINVVLPIVLLLLFAGIYTYLRKKLYTR